MSYETWHYLHFATYLAVFLAFGHQLSNGADFVGNRPAQLAWYALYLGGGGAAGLVPVRSSRYGGRCATGCASPRSAPRRRAWSRCTSPGSAWTSWRAEPGQFFRWRFLARGLWWAANPYSLSAAAAPARTCASPSRTPAATARPSPGCAPGTRVLGRGPVRGLHRRAAAARRRSCCSAGGVGITPLRALFETLPGEVTLIYRARRPEDLALRAELDAIAAAPRRGRPLRRRRARRVLRAAHRRRRCASWCPTWPRTTSTCAARPA